MSMDPRDRVLDYALEVLLGEAEEEPDLAPRVAEALRNGTEHEDLEVLLEEEPAAAERLRSRARLSVERPWRWIAAAALVLVSLAVAVWFARPDAAPPESLATASSPVLLLGGSAEGRLGVDVRPGDRIVVPVGDEVDLRLAGGDVLSAEGPTLLSLAVSDDPAAEDLEVSLLLGRLRLEKVSAGFVDVHTDFVRLSATKGTTLAVGVDIDPSSPLLGNVTDPNVAQKLFQGGLDVPRLLSVTVKRGRVELAHQGKSELLRAGDTRKLWSEEPADSIHTPSGEDLVHKMLTGIADAGTAKKAVLGVAGDVSPKLVEITGDLSALLEEKPQYWTTVREVILAWADDPRLRPFALRNAVELVLLDESTEAFDVARELWLRRPDVFAEHQIVGFAERDAFEFQRELSAMVDMWNGGPEPAPVLAAAWLSRRGDREGIALLEQVLDGGMLRWEDVWPTLLAGYALDSIGDQAAWVRLLPMVEGYVEKVLADGPLVDAELVVLALDHLDQVRLRQEEPLLSGVPRELELHVLERVGKLDSPALIRERLASLVD